MGKCYEVSAEPPTRPLFKNHQHCESTRYGPAGEELERESCDQRGPRRQAWRDALEQASLLRSEGFHAHFSLLSQGRSPVPGLRQTHSPPGPPESAEQRSAHPPSPTLRVRAQTPAPRRSALLPQSPRTLPFPLPQSSPHHPDSLRLSRTRRKCPSRPPTKKTCVQPLGVENSLARV